MICTSIDPESRQPRHDDPPRDVLARRIVKMQVFYNEIVATEDYRVAAGIAGSGIGELGQLSRPVGSQSYRLGSCARLPDPNITGEGRPLLKVDYISSRQ